MASIADGELRAYARRHILQTVGLDHKVITASLKKTGVYLDRDDDRIHYSAYES